MSAHKEFYQVIDGQCQESKGIHLLPLCHTTTEGYFMNIFLSKEVSCNHDYDVNEDGQVKERVAYFFYGKPSYLVYKEGENFTNMPPITLIYEPNDIDIEMASRVLPFDSGGFHRYEMPAGYKRKNFTYKKPNEDAVKALIKLLYGSNLDYLTNNVDLPKLEPFVKECWSLKEIINLYNRAARGEIESGDQVYSIELQFARSVAFKPKYIMLPYTFQLSNFWSEENFNTDFPDIQIEYYGMKEIMKNRGKALKAEDYHRIMCEEVMNLIREKLPQPALNLTNDSQ